MKTVLNAITHSFSAAAATATGAPEWVHLLPAGEFKGEDGRGPYQVDDMAGLIAASLAAGRKLAIDINHSIDLKGSSGDASPAVGWIVEMEARDGALWGKVDWTEEGRKAVEGRAYGYISPVFNAAKGPVNKIVQFLRASLTNDPNLTLTSLHQKQKGLDMEEELRKALGLSDTADQTEIVAAVTKALNSSTAAATTLAKVAEAVGVKKDASGDELVTALNAKTKAVTSDDTEKAELKDQVKTLNSRLTEVINTGAKKDAEAAIDRAIEDGKVVPALRDRYIVRHMKDPADVDAEIKLMPSLHSAGLGQRRPIPATIEGGLSGDDATVCELMGLDPKKFAETSKAIAKEML